MEIAIHAVVILGLLYIAIVLHFLTIKIKNNETQKKPRTRKKKTVLHSKPRGSKAVNFPLEQKQEEGEDPSPFTQALIDFTEQKTNN